MIVTVFFKQYFHSGAHGCSAVHALATPTLRCDGSCALVKNIAKVVMSTLYVLLLGSTRFVIVHGICSSVLLFCACLNGVCCHPLLDFHRLQHSRVCGLVFMSLTGFSDWSGMCFHMAWSSKWLAISVRM
jgi:hypothetical protein